MTQLNSVTFNRKSIHKWGGGDLIVDSSQCTVYNKGISVAKLVKKLNGSSKLTSPLCEPVTTFDKLTGLLRRALTPSVCPSSEPRNGFANTLSSFVALSARTYSLDVVKGWSEGSKFLCTINNQQFIHDIAYLGLKWSNLLDKIAWNVVVTIINNILNSQITNCLVS